MLTDAGRATAAPTRPEGERRRHTGRSRWVVDAAMWVGALLVAVSAGIHLHLWLTGYSSIPTVGPLFVAQAVVGFVLAAVLAWTRRPGPAIVSSLFLLATIGGLLLSAWFGFFGFHDSFDAPYAGLSLVVEASGAAILLLAGAARAVKVG